MTYQGNAEPKQDDQWQRVDVSMFKHVSTLWHASAAIYLNSSIGAPMN
jgi:hypothetical protein